MTIACFPRRRAAWLAAAAMALNTAWPLLANTKPSAPPSEICSATGAKHAPAAPARDLHASHCTLCPFGCAAALPHAAPLLARGVAGAPSIARGEASRAGIAFHPAAPPRAPPVLS